MRLTALQKGLWAVTAAVVAAWGVWWALGGLEARSQVTAQATQTEAFQPTFTLPDADGHLVTSEDLRGRYLLVFFGFTNCPDVCPMTLSEVAQVMDDLGPHAARVQPVFVSVDPVRDRDDLGAYTAAFHPMILGLAGNETETRAAADSFKVFYEREDDAAAPDGYTMSHASSLYLVGPQGNWLRQFEYGTPATDILADLRSRL